MVEMVVLVKVVVVLVKMVVVLSVMRRRREQ